MAQAISSRTGILVPTAIKIPRRPLRWAVVGDSYVQVNGYGTSLTNASTAAGQTSLLNVLSGNAFLFDPIADQFGVSGGKMTDAIAQIGQIISRSPDVLIVQCGGHNDYINYGSAYFPTLQVLFKQFLDAVMSAGILPVVVLEYVSAQTGAGLSNSQLRQLVKSFNAWKRSYAQSVGALVWDWHTPTVDPASASGAIKSAFMDDGIHANFAGNLAIAQQGMSDLLQLLGSKCPMLVSAQDDTYDANYNPYGNLATDPLFLTGTSLSAPWSGTKPTNWGSGQVLQGTGKTIAGSLIAAADGIGQWYQMSVSGVSSGAGNNQIVWLARGSLGASLPAGSVVEGWVEVSVDANSPFHGVTGKVVAGANQALGNNLTQPGGSANTGPTSAWGGVIYIPPVQIPATGYTGMVFYMQAQYNDASSTFAGTVRFRRPTLRLVAN